MISRMIRSQGELGFARWDLISHFFVDLVAFLSLGRTWSVIELQLILHTSLNFVFFLSSSV